MRKKTINLTVPADLADAFDGVCGRYGHGKQKGMVLSAAILMFMETSGGQQAAYVKRVAVAEVEGRLLSAEQRALTPRVSEAQSAEATVTDRDPRQRLAARRAPNGVRRGRRGLPPLPG